MKKLLLPLFLILNFSLMIAPTGLAQTSRTWDGSSGTDWNTAANWTPSGVPATIDHVTIPSTANKPELDGNVTIANFSITGGELDLDGDTLTVNGSLSMTGGTVKSGLVKKTSATGVTITGVTVECGLEVTGVSMSITDSRFLHKVNLTATSGSNTLAGNVWESDVALTNVGSGSNLSVGFNQPDTVLGHVTLTNNGRGYTLGNPSTSSALVFAGSGAQHLKMMTGGINGRRVTFDKPSGQVNLTGELTITHFLHLTKGIVRCESGAQMTLNNNVTVSGTSHDSYIEGPVLKKGNQAFTFPVGRNGHYRPISISAPASSTAQFKATYLNLDVDDVHDVGVKDVSLTSISTNEYWTLERLASVNTVNVTLSWDDMSCEVGTLANLRVTGWDGSKWKDRGNGGTTGNATAGTVVTSSAPSAYNEYTLASTDAWDCVPCRADAGTDTTVTIGGLPQLGEASVLGSTYAWSPSSGLNDDTISAPFASPDYTTIYSLSVTNESGCVASDDVSVGIFAPWFVYYDESLISAISAGSALHNLGGIDTLYTVPYFTRVVVTMDTTLVGLVSALSWVTDVVRYPRMAMQVADSRQMINVTDIQASPWGAGDYDLTGDGVIIGMWDGGYPIPHDDYDGRVTVVDTDPTIGSIGNIHATWVCGILAGDGTNNMSRTGMAPEASVKSWSFLTVEGEDFIDVVFEFVEGVNDHDIVISNNSWGASLAGGYTQCGTFGAYTSFCGEFDRVVRDKGLSAVFGVGNHIGTAVGCGVAFGGIQADGYMSVQPYSTAKNVIGVGGIAKDGQMYSLSGWGPTHDGRLKPDVVAVAGQSTPPNTVIGVTSCGPNNNYHTDHGVSAACPAVTGAATLLIEHFRNLNSGTTPRPDLLKAIILNTAEDIENPGPDYKTGYGVVDALAAAKLIDSDNWLLDEVAHSGTETHTISLDCAVPELRVMMAYSDIEVIANLQLGQSALVNDLNMRLLAPDGTTYHYPFILDPANPSNNATTGVNFRDNVEQVVVVNPALGEWTVEISGYDVPDGPQPYAVLWYTPDLVEVTDETFPFTDTDLNTALGVTSGTTITNKAFSVNGTWTLAASTTLILDNCNIAMGPEAAIIVPATSTLELRGTHISSCSDMWDGIYVANGAHVTVTDGSLIEDAIYALYMFYGADWEVDNATFNRNLAHIYIKWNPGSITYGPTSIINSTFACQTTASLGGTPVHTNLRPPLDTDITYIGVYMEHVAGTLSVGTTGNGNTFDNSDFGVLVGYAAQVFARDNTFTDHRDAGIHTLACGTNDGTISLINNEVNRTPFGIICQGSNTARITIEDNTISFASMTSPPDEMTAITVDEIAPASPNNFVSIVDNHIIAAPCGIHVRNLDGDISGGTGTVYIGDNIITHARADENDPQAGILLENVTGGLVIDNDVRNASYTVNNWERAIRMDGGSSSQFICNDVHDIGRGFFFLNDVSPTVLAKNIMADNQTGILLHDAIIGPQGNSTTPHDNEWDTGTSWASGNPHIHCLGTGANGNLSTFEVYNTGAEFYPQHRTAAFGGSIVPTPSTTGNTWTADCVFIAPSFKTEEGNPEVEQALTFLSSDANAVTLRDSSMRWAGEYNLYKRLNKDMELRHSDNALTAFHGEMDNGSMGRLHRAVTGFNALRHANSGASLSGSAQEQLGTVQGLASTFLPEQRLAEVLDVLYQNIEDLRSMSSGHVARLREIAHLCPLDDGFAVHMARSALAELDTLPRHYPNTCQSDPEQEDNNWKQETSNVIGAAEEFHIYPNPNNGVMTLSYLLQEGERGMLRVFSIIGELLHQQPLNTSGTTMSVQLNGVSSGFYIVKVEVNDMPMLTQRISVLRE